MSIKSELEYIYHTQDDYHLYEQEMEMLEHINEIECYNDFYEE